MLTLDEVCEKLLVRYDTELLVELLSIEAPELLDRFEDKLELHREAIEEALDESE